MKLKKLMLVTFVLLAILTIGAVSAADDVASDNLTVSDDGDSIEAPVNDGDLLSDGDDPVDDPDEDPVDDPEEDPEDDPDYEGDEDEGMLYIEDDKIIVDSEVVGLNTETEMDSGRLVVFDVDTDAVYFNKTLAEMEYNTDWMKYKFNSYDGYYIFVKDLNIEKSGEYNINATYYDDEYQIIESLTGTVILDCDTFMNEDEIDINDDETEVIAVTVFDEYIGGKLTVSYAVYGDTEEDDEFFTIYERLINDDDAGTVIRLTLKDLDIQPGFYEGVSISCISDEDEITIYEGKLSIVDNTLFRFKIENEYSILDKNEVVFIYCPQSSAGSEIKIKVNDFTLTHKITAEEAGDYIGFILSQLNITELGEYDFDIYDSDDEQLIETYSHEFENPINFMEQCKIGTDDDDILELRTPKEFNDGRLVITDEEGNEIFNKTLAEMNYRDFGWDNAFRYYVKGTDLDAELESGSTYTFHAYYYGEVNFDNEGEVEILEAKSAEKDGVTIALYDFEDHDIYENTIAKVSAPGEGYVVVTIKVDKDDIRTYDDYEYEREDGAFYISMYDETLEPGTYQVTVSYYDADDNEILNLTSDFTFYNDEDDEDDEDDPYNLYVPSEFDINDDDAVIISIYCPEGTEGVFYIDGDVAYINEDGDEDDIEFNPLIYEITQSDWDNVINWTVSDLSVKKAGKYDFYVHLLQSLEDEANDDNIICDGGGDARDYTQFWVEWFNDEFALTNNNDIIYVYCPEESTGTVIVTVREGDDEDGIPHSKDVSQNEDNWLSWNLHELGMDSLGEYSITIEANGKILTKEAPVWIVNPIYFNEDVFYIGTSDFERGNILEVEISSDVTEGRIIITYNGEEIFNKTLADFSNDENSNLFWFHPSHGPGPGDETIKKYQINYNNLDNEFEEGTYELAVTLIYDGSKSIENTGNITFAKPKIATEGDYSIIIYDAQEYELGTDWFCLAEIIAPKNADGTVKITVKDNDWTWEKELADLDEGAIRPTDFEGLDEGEYEITISYFENDELIVNNTATITFFIDEGDDPNDGAEYIFLTDDGVNPSFDVNTESNVTGRLIVKDEDVFIYEWNLSEIAEYSDDDNRWHHDIHLDTEILDEGKYTITLVYEDEEGNVMESRTFEIEIGGEPPEIFVMWSDWPDFTKVEYALDSEYMVHIYPNDDDSENIRIIVEIEGEVYLNKTLAELDLEMQVNDDNEGYYTVGPVNFEKEIALGYHDNVVAYYISDKYSVRSDEGDMPTYVTILDSSENTPDIRIMYTDWDKNITEFYLNENPTLFTVWSFDLDVNLSDLRVAFLIGDEVLLNDTVNNLYYDTVIDEYGVLVIDIKINNTNIAPGHYENAVAYCYINGHERSSAEFDDSVNSFDVYNANVNLNILNEPQRLDDEHLVHIENVERASGRLIIKANDVVYFNKTLAELGEIQYYDECMSYYNVGVVDFTSPITPGTYDLEVNYIGDDGFVTDNTKSWNEVATSLTISEDKVNPKLNISIDNVEEDNPIVVNVTAMIHFIGDVVVDINGTKVNVHVENGKGSNVTSLSAGNYLAKIDFAETGTFNADYAETSFNVIEKVVPPVPTPVDPELAIAPVSDVEEGTNVTITISAAANFTGSVKVLVGDVEVSTADIAAGSGTFNIAADKLAVGVNTVKVVSEASENFTAGEANATFNVTEKVVPPVPTPVDPELAIAPVSDVEEGSDVVITISALCNFTGSVKVLVGDVEVGSADVSAGAGSFTIAAGNFTVGANTVKVVCDASENFTADEANVTFNVTEKVVPPAPEPVDPNLTISIDDIRNGTDAVIIITTNQTFSGNVTVQIASDNYDVSVVNGTGSYTVSGLAVGNYTATATFEATEAFNASTKNATFKVNKEVVPDAETSISTDSASASSKNPVYSIKLNPDATGTLRVKIGNNTYTKELKDGEATIEVTDLPAGTYEAVVSYSGDAKYAPISKTVNSTVKVETAIKATAVTTTYGTSKNIVITLTDANGNVIADKQVTVVLNGVSKTLTTNAKGQATYAIGTKLAVKKYDATVTFAGDDGYVKSTGTAKVTVNKAKPILTAKKKTFKVKKAKKYTVTLKTDKKKALKKVKVTLTGKFKGKKIKITVKTNKKGKATFNLKKLTKKGKFKATIKFAGNKYYKAASKKAKITVK